MSVEVVSNGKQAYPNDFNFNSSFLAYSYASLSIKPPAIVRHLAFLYPQREQRDLSPESATGLYSMYKGIPSKAEAFNQITPIIQLFARNLVDSEKQKFKSDFQASYDAGESFVASLSQYAGSRFYGLQIRILVDLNSEYAALTIVLDNERRLSGEFADVVRRASHLGGGKARDDKSLPYLFPEVAKEGGESPLFEEVTGENAASWWRAEKQRRKTGNTNRPTCAEDAVDIVYFEFWEEFEKKFGLDLEIQNLIEAHNNNDKLRLFADFRGFITRPRKYECLEQLRFRPKNVSMNNSLQDVESYLVDMPDFPLAVVGLDKNWESASGAPSGSRIEPNAIMCKMLAGTAIYCSTLSSRMSLSRSRQEKMKNVNLIPVRYHVIFGGDNNHQIGRLIRRLHSLGELRHAALQDYKVITEIGKELQRLGSRIAAASDACTADPFGFDRKRVDELVKDYVSLGAQCHGGLAYRTMRSKYYQEILYNNIPDLYPVEMPGWQSYPGFIKRNFDSKFRTIVSVGERYRDIGLRLDRLISISDTARQYNFTRVPALLATFGVMAAIFTLFISNGVTLGQFFRVSPVVLEIIGVCLSILAIALVWLQTGRRRVSAGLSDFTRNLTAPNLCRRVDTQAQ